MNPQELVNDVKEIKRILTELEKRKEPATAEQLKAIINRPITLDPKAFANHVQEDLKDALPSTEAIKTLLTNFIEQMRIETNGHVKKINQSIEHIPRKIPVTGDIYGFTNFKAAFIYGSILSVTFLCSWFICDYYRNQAQESTIYKQSQEISLERDFYHTQIEQYKNSNPSYSYLFPPYKKSLNIFRQ